MTIYLLHRMMVGFAVLHGVRSCALSILDCVIELQEEEVLLLVPSPPPSLRQEDGEVLQHISSAYDMLISAETPQTTSMRTGNGKHALLCDSLYSMQLCDTHRESYSTSVVVEQSDTPRHM